MSPHLQVWRWHPAMMSSIVHRASAIICYTALILVAVGVLILSLTGSLPLEGLIFSPLGALGLFVFLFAFIFMALAQLRHAVWDKGAMLKPELNNLLSYVMLFGSILLAFAITFLATGAI
jgi:succinate dehydrogenase / fumarate reductase cytochrome b subunit